MKGFRLTTFLALAALAAGCSRVQPDGLDERTEIVSVSLEGCGPHTRVRFDEDGTLNWNEEIETGDGLYYFPDRIDIHTTAGSYETFTVDAAQNQVSVTLSGGELRDGFAVYPAGIVQNNSTESVTIAYPSEYHPFTSDMPGPSYDAFMEEDMDINYRHVRIPMIAVSNSESSLFFRHVGGLLAFHFASEGNDISSSISKITITVGGDNITGIASVADPSSSHPVATIASQNGGHTVTIDFSLSERLMEMGIRDFRSAYVSIPVPCGTYNGITIRCYDDRDVEIGGYADDIIRVIGRGEARSFGDVFSIYYEGAKVFAAFTIDHILLSNNGSSVSSSGLYLTPGETETLVGTLYANNFGGDGGRYSANDPRLITTIAPVKYYSRNTSVVSIDENTGAMLAVAPGVTQVYATATYLGRTVTSADCNVHVTSGFSVAANKKVFIAPGNLKYVNGKYSFHEHGYMTVLPTSGAVIGSQSAAAILNGNHDLFYWSQLAPFNNDFLGGWRILTNEEWQYLFVSRPSSKFGYCMINDPSIPGIDTNRGILGLVLLPDDFTDPLTSISNGSGGAFAGGANAGPTSNINLYNLEGWLAMEAAGAVFLPNLMFGDQNSDQEAPVIQAYALRYFSIEGQVVAADECGGYYPTSVDYIDYKYEYWSHLERAIFTRLVRDAN